MTKDETPRNILLVCVGNKTRSIVAEQYIRRELNSRGYNTSDKTSDSYIQVSSAGIVAGKGGRQFTEDMGAISDLIVAMDEWIKYSLISSFHQQKNKVTALDILDLYDEDIEGLISALRTQLLPFIQRYFPRREK